MGISEKPKSEDGVNLIPIKKFDIQCMSIGFMSLIWTCDATLRMRVRSSFWKPFITDITVIKAVIPSVIPNSEISEMNEIK